MSKKLSERLQDAFNPEVEGTLIDQGIIDAIRDLEAENEARGITIAELADEVETLRRERDEARANAKNASDMYSRILNQRADWEDESDKLYAERDAALAKLAAVREWAERAAEDYGDEWENGYCAGGLAVLAILDGEKESVSETESDVSGGRNE